MKIFLNQPEISSDREHLYLADESTRYDSIGGHPDSETEGLITVAGQRRTFTELSPLPLMTAPHQNRQSKFQSTMSGKLWKPLTVRSLCKDW